jgi:hypothetical protein
MRRTRSTLLCAGVTLIGCLAAHLSAAEPIVIENETLQVALDAAASTFSLRHKSSGTDFATGGKLGGSGGAATVTTVVNAKFGEGRQISVRYPNGNADVIELFPGLPLALFHAVLHNGGTTETVIHDLRTVSVELQLGRPWNELRALGTAGLTAVDKNPGSYTYLAVADPATRAGVVGGWLTQDRGSGVVFSPIEQNAARMVAQLDYGRLRILPGQDARTETFALGWFEDARCGLESYADAVARIYSIKLPPQPAGYCTWYAEQFGGACDEKHLSELAAFAAERLKPFGFQFVQIDDGWQDGISTNGPCRNFTAHRPGGPYPNGMQAVAADIARRELTPGIWFMPFAGTSYDPFFRDHQDWFAKGPDGKPFETTWGGTCLDLTHPGTREHVRQVVRRLAHDWGFRFFKMDGLWTGTATRLMYVNDGYQDDKIGESQLQDPDKTPIEAYRDGLKLVRETAGPDVFLLGCCVAQNMRSLGGSFGLVDAMRIGPDTGAGHIGAPHGSRNYFLHGRVWQNDPDCVSVRAGTSLDQARLNATWTAISGQLFYCSDWLPGLPPERLDILQRTMPAHGLLSRPVDLFESEPARIWLLTDTRRTVQRNVVALYNWNEKETVRFACAAERLGLPSAPEYVAFDFWGNTFLPPLREISAELPPASCRVLAIRPVADVPQLISTSRHVTQGMIDVLDERWDGAARALHGVSRVVGGDPYELRIVAPTGAGSWMVRDVHVVSDDAAAQVNATFQQEGNQVRVHFTSRVDGDVHWKVQY